MNAEIIHVVFSAPDISCEHCRRAIEDAVGALDGVEYVEVDVATKTVDVRLSGPGADTGEVRRAIEEAGYPVSDERTVS
jgi:copper ion binding protein